MESSVSDKLTATIKVKTLTGSVSCYMIDSNNNNHNMQWLTNGINVINFEKDNLQELRIELGTNSSIQIEWIKLEQGSIATPFAPRPYAEELLLCQRYYKVLQATGFIGYGSASANTINVPCEHMMRLTPDVANASTILNDSLRVYDNGSYTNVKITGATCIDSTLIFTIDSSNYKSKLVGAYVLTSDYKARPIHLDAEIY